MQPRLTIVALNFDPEPTGTAPYTTFLAQHLASTGWEVTVVAGTPHYPQWGVHKGYQHSQRRILSSSARVLHLRHYVPSRPRLTNRVLMEVHFGLQAMFADWRDPDVVLFVSPALFSTAMAMAAGRLRYRQARTVVWVQDLYTRGVEEAHASASRWIAPLRRIEGAVLSAADRVIVIHDRFRRYVQEDLGVPSPCVREIRNWSHIPPVHDTNRPAIRSRFGWTDDQVIVLHAGNMGVKQNLENVVDAARISEQKKTDLRFVLLGSGNQREVLEARAVGLSCLQFIDPLPDDQYAAALSAADILLVNERPGLQEMSVPSKLTSYFSSGRPVVGAVGRGSATASEIDRSGAGIVVPSGNPAVLCQALRRLGLDLANVSSMGENGLGYAREHLSAEAAMRRWDDVLRLLIGR